MSSIERECRWYRCEVSDTDLDTDASKQLLKIITNIKYKFCSIKNFLENEPFFKTSCNHLFHLRHLIWITSENEYPNFFEYCLACGGKFINGSHEERVKIANIAYANHKKNVSEEKCLEIMRKNRGEL